MKSLGYILKTTFKNYIKDLKNHKGQLVLIVVLALVLIMNTYTAANSVRSADYYRNIEELYAIVLLFYLFTFTIYVKTGFDSGASFYHMADVNLVFTAPISTTKILIYGLLRQIGMSLLIGFFLIYQYGWLNNTYGLSMTGLLFILLGYGVIMFCSQLAAMAIYSCTCNSQRRRNMLLYCITGASVAVVLLAAYGIYEGGMTLESAVRVANMDVFKFIPVAGWTKSAVVWAIGGSMSEGIAGILADALFILLFIVMIVGMRPDFYEDVLQATEVSANAVTARKQGNVSDVPKHVRRGKTGIGHGHGAGVFFYKHMLESRRSGVLLLDKMSVISIASTAVAALFMGQKAGLGMVFGVAAYIQFLFSVSYGGRWMKELRMPYVYLVPAGSFAKLCMILWENIFRLLAESAVIFIIVGFIMNLSVLEVASCVAARFGLGLVFMSGSMIMTKFMGMSGSQVLSRLGYFLVMIVALIPVVAIGFIAAPIFYFVPFVSAVLFGISVSGILTSALIMALCRNVLECAELINK